MKLKCTICGDLFDHLPSWREHDCPIGPEDFELIVEPTDKLPVVEPTPRPWTRKGEKLYGPDKRVAACCCQGFRTFAEGEANAALILTAVNTHAALLAACKAAQGKLLDIHSRFRSADERAFGGDLRDTLAILQAALTQAEVPDAT